jgi:gas vesicle protein
MDGGNEMSTETTNSSGFWQGILIGGALATVSTLLYAPKARKSLRKKIVNLFQLKKSSIQPPSPVKHTINSMAQNEHEMAKLGEEMKHMKTNTQITKSGMVPDPIQNE